jgi:hypothetical protein
MLTYRQALTYLLLNYFVIYATRCINLYVFNGKLSSLALGLLTASLVLGAYPLLAWRRNSPWVRIGSFGIWSLIALCVGLLTFLLDVGVAMVTRHYSPS